MGARRPFFVMAPTLHDKEKVLTEDVAKRVESGLPGVEVLAVELAGPEHFTVFIDGPEGVDHQLCERVTGLLRDYLREFAVDVSSPGIERPLRKPAHFREAVGRRVKLRTPERKRLRGEVLRADERAVTVRTETEEIEIPYEAIVRGNLVDTQRGSV
jgi:ribosome maturation factor RimP